MDKYIVIQYIDIDIHVDIYLYNNSKKHIFVLFAVAKNYIYVNVCTY